MVTCSTIELAHICLELSLGLHMLCLVLLRNSSGYDLFIGQACPQRLTFRSSCLSVPIPPSTLAAALRALLVPPSALISWAPPTAALYSASVEDRETVDWRLDAQEMTQLAIMKTKPDVECLSLQSSAQSESE